MEHEAQPLVGSKQLSWLSVGCGVASWLLAGVVPVGIEVVGMILGVMALRGADDDPRAGRRIALWGLAISGAKLLAMAILFAWVVLSFAVNPVAH